jgi:hypothetical protein
MNLNLAERYFDGFVTEHIIPPPLSPDSSINSVVVAGD